MQYLKQRTLNFSEAEKAVTLLIDEVYTANRAEYQNKTFFGLTEACARIVLTFMVQSVCKNCKDVVFYLFLFFIFISIFILLTHRKATEALYIG